ncbi:cytochrome P450 [Parvularcula sp. ZS-1/3]|uniref:Cytochrome P450 n=1 Tax=Parvularcula mediterranea TaxID=2732508 RepID=A0A7Y3RM59_9PROT|nr:cytochrome P450 [Parvularcula mediterranea]
MDRIRAVLHSGLSIFPEGAFSTGGVTKNKVPKIPMMNAGDQYSVRDPETIREMLVKRPMEFPKGKLMDDMLRKLTGYSIFVSNGEAWERQRRIIDQAFTHAGVRGVFPMMQDAVLGSLDRIEGAVGQETDVQVEMTHYAGDIIFRTIYSEGMTAEQAKTIFSAFDKFQEVAYRQGMIATSGFPLSLLPSNLAALWTARVIRAELDKPLKRRLDAVKSGEDVPDTDILSSFMTSEDPVTKTKFDRGELLDQIAMLFLAGHETSAAALGWALYLLAHDQEAQNGLRAEARRVLGDRAPEFSDIKKLEFTRNIFRETMRLYPPVAFLSRDVVGDESMCGRDVAAGSAAVVPVFVMHRHEDHWEAPHVFAPERFAQEKNKEAIRGAFMPFSMGARVCVGAAFALQEATLLLAQLVRKFRVLPVDHEPDPVARLTVRSANGIRLRFERAPEQ